MKDTIVCSECGNGPWDGCLCPLMAKEITDLSFEDLQDLTGGIPLYGFSAFVILVQMKDRFKEVVIPTEGVSMEAFVDRQQIRFQT